MPVDPADTIRTALAWARTRLPAGEARLDSEVLLAHVLQCARTYLYAHDADALPPAARDRFAQLVERRRDGEPVAYLIGTREFWSMELAVGRATLVPRPETEGVVAQALRMFAGDSARILDLGTGSGAIALALAKERPAWQLLGVDISPQAVVIARANAQRLGLANARFETGDWYEPCSGSYDLIVSNPPYIRSDDPCLESPGLRHEPRAALASGREGLDALRVVITGAPRFLVPGGGLVCEHGASQGEQVRALFAAAGFRTARTERDLAGHERLTWAGGSAGG